MKQLIPPFTLVMLLCGGLSAQTLVSTEPMQKNVLLEEYTGIDCSACPWAHDEAESILGNNPGRVFVTSAHVGQWAVPKPGQPDFRTPFGEALYEQSEPTGLPRGTINRHSFNGTNTSLIHYIWAENCNLMLEEMSPVNIGAAADYDASSRTLTVNVELYYTANAPASSNFINIALTQDSIYGPQINGGAGNNYLHMHMLRHLLTGQWGDEVTTTTQGTLVTRTYTYVVPEDYNDVPTVVENMKVVAFVAEGHQEVYTATRVDINILMTAIDAAVSSQINGQNYPNPAKEFTFIRVTEAAKGGAIEIYNLSGQLLSKQNIESSLLTRVDVSQLPEGVYVYRVISGNNSSEARKLTVIR